MTIPLQYFLVSASKIGPKSPEVLKVFQRAISEKQSAASAISELKSRGLSYRRTNMLSDFRRMQHISKVKVGNVEGQKKALDFFDKVVEPYRKAHNTTYDKAIRDLREHLKGQVDTIKKAKEIEGYLNDYGFGATP